MTKLRPITVDEVVQALLDGKRDFSNTRLVGKKNLSGHKGYAKMQNYLKELLGDELLKQNPVRINGSDWNGFWNGLIAEELFFPFLKATGAVLSKADLSGANLYRADLSGANLYRADLYEAVMSGVVLKEAKLRRAVLSEADLYEADLSGAKLYRADLSGAKLYGAVLSRADLSRADLSGADLSGAVNLEKALGISDGFYKGTIISPEQEGIMITAFEKAGKELKPEYFVVR